MELNEPGEEIKFVTFRQIGVMKRSHSLWIFFRGVTKIISRHSRGAGISTDLAAQKKEVNGSWRWAGLYYPSTSVDKIGNGSFV